MQNGFFQKVFLCMIIGAVLAGFVEFYKTFIEGADDALNGKHRHVQIPTPNPGKGTPAAH